MADRRTDSTRLGFTLIELVVVICIVALLVGFAARRLMALRVDAERAAVHQVVGGLQAAVSLELLTRITRGDDEDRSLAALEGSNPMQLLVDPPYNYVGERDGPRDADLAESVAPGRWYFDRRAAQLVYRVRYPARFETELPGTPRAAFRVELLWDDRDGDGRFDAGVDGIGGARLASVADYGWKP